MVQTGSVHRWRFLIAPRWLAWHVFAVVAFAAMCWLGDWQLHRALSGNDLSWAYTFEWPLFAVTGAWFWAKTIRDEAGPHDTGTAAAREPSDTGNSDTGGTDSHLAQLRREVRRHGRWHGLR